MAMSLLCGKRRLEPELMDDPALDPREHRRALRGLRRINRISHAAGSISRPLIRMGRSTPVPLRILDVACGGGEVTLGVQRRLRRAGVKAEVVGCDLSPIAIDTARRRATGVDTPLRFERCNVLSEGMPMEADAVITSLFLHHLTREQAILLLQRMASAARRLVVVHDLRRTTRGWLLAWIGTRLLSRSRVVHVDGPRSVRAAFTMAEAKALAEEAGLRGATIRKTWPQRYLLTWSKP